MLAIGRRNWLFAGSDTGGERAAVIYNLIRTAKLNALNPQAYLRDVPARIGDHPTVQANIAMLARRRAIGKAAFAQNR